MSWKEESIFRAWGRRQPESSARKPPGSHSFRAASAFSGSISGSSSRSMRLRRGSTPASCHARGRSITMMSRVFALATSSPSSVPRSSRLSSLPLCRKAKRSPSATPSSRARGFVIRTPSGVVKRERGSEGSPSSAEYQGRISRSRARSTPSSLTRRCSSPATPARVKTGAALAIPSMRVKAANGSGGITPSPTA